MSRTLTKLTHAGMIQRHIDAQDSRRSSITLTWAGLAVSDKEGARREKERGGRVAGANRGSTRAAHADAEYDVEIDTTDGQLAALAQELHSKYLACPHPEAFGRLRKRLLS